MRFRSLLLVIAVLLTSLGCFGQPSPYSKLLENQLRCRSNPEAGKLLIDMRKDGYISRTYVVEDTVSYFKLHKPLRVLGFSPVAVFGFQQGYEKFFVRGPGTLPPEMIGIVVRGNQDSVKLRLRKMGIDNLEIEPHEYDINGHDKIGRASLVAIACWAN